MINSTLRLFNAVQVESKQKNSVPKDILERTVRNGYVLNPAIKITELVLDEIEKVVGISGEKANASFHKSWKIVKDSSIEALVMQQIVHYITTYGFEAMGIYNKDSVYIPNEVLELPEIKDSISLTVIKAMTSKEILDKIIILSSGIALSQETLDDIMVIIKNNNYDKDIVDNVSNRELKALLCDYYNCVPNDPVEFLRHLISKLTNESLLIKNENLINKIKESNGKFLDTLLKDAPANLASIFFRFKPLFLAMKSISNNKKFFNQLRKQANTLHVPMPEDYLNSVTSQIKHKTLDLDKLTKRLEKASVFRKIRLAHALNYRRYSNDSIVYRVRNGKGWATTFNWNSELLDNTNKALTVVTDAIIKDIRTNVEGKTIYIPANINYAMPATEKQFVGQLPTGTWVAVPENLIVGIHWFNVDRNRIDLDLSLMDLSEKIGWDGDYRNEERDILFSGDVTDAPKPKGASELFYIKSGLKESKLLVANYYNYEEDIPVDCKVLVAHKTSSNFENNYMVDTSNIVCSSNVKISKKQNILGLITNVNGENRVYFTNMSIGNARTASNDDWVIRAREYLMASTVNTIDFKKLLVDAGAIVVDEVPGDEFIDLSPENVSKETFISLLLDINKGGPS